MRIAEGFGLASAKTDSDGHYELTRLPEGSLLIVARSPDYEAATADSIEAGDFVPDLVLKPYGSLLGRISSANTGKPVTRFRVEIERQSAADGPSVDSIYLFGQERDFKHPEGVFQYRKVAAGNYQAIISAEDYAPLIKRFDVKAGEEVAIDAVLEAGARVEGVLRSAETNEAVVGARVSVMRMDYDKATNAESGGRVINSRDDGSFVLAGLRDGSYRVYVSHRDYYWDGDVGGIGFRIPLEKPITLDIAMHAAGRLKGQIRRIPEVDPSKEEYTLILRRIDEEERGRTKSRGESPGAEASRPVTATAWLNRTTGQYHLDSLRPGKYEVRLVKFMYVSGDFLDAADETSARDLGEVEIGVGETRIFDRVVR